MTTNTTNTAAAASVPDLQDLVSKAMRRAWQLGQTHWQQADSESYRQNKQAGETQAVFVKLVDETRAALAAPAQAVPAAPGQARDAARVFWQQHTQADALSMTMAELHDDVEIVIRAARRAAQAAPEGWVPCVITYEGQHPEEVAYGPKIMMERLKKWLDRYFELRAQPAAQAAPVDAAKLPSPANVGTAPKCLNLNDQAMWVLGWNECLDAARAAHGITAAQKGGQDAE